MPLIINGVTVDVVVANGVTLDALESNGVQVFEKKAPPGSQTFTASGTFVVPTGYSSVTICMCGGGGSGSHVLSTDGYTIEGMGGGYAGVIVSQAVAVTSGASISVTIGSGGARRYSTGYVHVNGLAGGSSAFGGVSAGGGAGGVGDTSAPIDQDHYRGNNGSRVSCGGTRYDGDGGQLSSWGGQAGAYGNGGAGATTVGSDGGRGAGGGGSSGGTNSGAGGAGYLVVSWS